MFYKLIQLKTSCFATIFSQWQLSLGGDCPSEAEYSHGLWSHPLPPALDSDAAEPVWPWPPGPLRVFLLYESAHWTPAVLEAL